MMRQQLGSALNDLRELPFKGFGDTGVKRASRLTQERAIRLACGVADNVAADTINICASRFGPNTGKSCGAGARRCGLWVTTARLPLL